MELFRAAERFNTHHSSPLQQKRRVDHRQRRFSPLPGVVISSSIIALYQNQRGREVKKESVKKCYCFVEFSFFFGGINSPVQFRDSRIFIKVTISPAMTKIYTITLGQHLSTRVILKVARFCSARLLFCLFCWHHQQPQPTVVIAFNRAAIQETLSGDAKVSTPSALSLVWFGHGPAVVFLCLGEQHRTSIQLTSRVRANNVTVRSRSWSALCTLTTSCFERAMHKVASFPTATGCRHLLLPLST